MKLTRRELAALASAAAIGSAQTQPAAAPADELQTARDRLKANSAALAEADLPAGSEPAFRFQP
jgi:hypothetical protein